MWLSLSEQAGSFNYNDAHPPFILDGYNPWGILNTYLHDLRTSIKAENRFRYFVSSLMGFNFCFVLVQPQKAQCLLQIKRD